MADHAPPRTPQPVAVDLETVSELLHVDARTMARMLQAPVGGREVDIDVTALRAAASGGATGVFALTEQLKPQAAPRLDFTPQFRTAMTPPASAQPEAKLAKWWQGEGGAAAGDAEAPPAAHHRPLVHAAIVERSRDEVLRLRVGSGKFEKYDEMTPLFGKRSIYEFKHPAVGVVEQPHPLTALVVPIDAEQTMLAVVDEDLDLEPKATPLITLPDEIKRVELRIREDEDHHLKLSMVVEFARPLIGWIILLVGVTCMAAVGPVIKMMSSDHVSGYVVGCWNAQGLFLMFSLGALFQGVGHREFAYLTSRFGFILLATAGIISGLGSGSWTLSFMYTSVSQSYLFNSFHPSLIIAWRLLSGKKVIRVEKLGVLLGLSGAAMSVLDGKGGPNVPLGDLLAFFSSLSLCFYLLASKKARNHLPLMLNLSFVTLFSSLSQFLMANYMIGGMTWDTNPVTGVFGWWDASHFRLWILITLVTGVGQAGYIGALKYLNPVVVSICMTTEPATATGFAVLLLGEGLPMMYTVIGGCLIILSSIVVSVFSVHSKENVEIGLDPEEVDLSKVYPDTPSLSGAGGGAGRNTSHAAGAKKQVVPGMSPITGVSDPRRSSVEGFALNMRRSATPKMSGPQQTA